MSDKDKCVEDWRNPAAVIERLESDYAALEAENRKLRDVASQAICSIGSFDRGLQEHYQKLYRQALTDAGKSNE